MMALTKDIMALTRGCNGTHNRMQQLSKQDMMALTKDVMGLTTGCNSSHNRI